MGNRIIAIFLLLAALGWAQNQDPYHRKKEPTERTLSGAVTNSDGSAAAGVEVQLKNMKTLQVRTFITKDKGDYVFTGLSRDTDYQVRARSKTEESAWRNLSSFDTKLEPVLNLQMKATEAK